MPEISPKTLKTALPDSSRLWQNLQPGDFIDGYAVASPLSPRRAMEIGLSMPKWASALLTLRNFIVKPLGLKTDVSEDSAQSLFPIIHEDQTELIIGADDGHLNFRIAVHRRHGHIHMATWVHRNNWLGRVYLVLVMPFHILIVRNAMRRIARAPIVSAGTAT